MRERHWYRIGQSVTANEHYVGDNNLKITKGNLYVVIDLRSRLNWCYVQIKDDNDHLVWMRQRYFKVKFNAEEFLEGWMT